MTVKLLSASLDTAADYVCKWSAVLEASLNMPREICSKCRELKSGVMLCADDLLCRECNEDNERQLAMIRKGKASVVLTASSHGSQRAAEASTYVVQPSVDADAAKSDDSKKASKPVSMATSTGLNVERQPAASKKDIAKGEKIHGHDTRGVKGKGDAVTDSRHSSVSDENRSTDNDQISRQIMESAPTAAYASSSSSVRSLRDQS